MPTFPEIPYLETPQKRDFDSGNSALVIGFLSGPMSRPQKDNVKGISEPQNFP